MVLGNKKKYFGTQKFRIFYIKNHPNPNPTIYLKNAIQSHVCMYIVEIISLNKQINRPLLLPTRNPSTRSEI